MGKKEDEEHYDRIRAKVETMRFQQLKAIKIKEEADEARRKAGGDDINGKDRK